MRITYDAQVDALYIQLRDVAPGQAENRDLGGGIVADYGPDGVLVGIEILDASLALGQDRDKVVVELASARKAIGS